MTTSKPVLKTIDFQAAAKLVKDFAAERNIPTKQYPDDVRPEGQGTPVPVAVAPSPPQVAPVTVPAPVRHTAPARTAIRKFTIDLPEYVIDAIQAKAFNSRPKRTSRHIIMSGLRAVGIDIDEADMPEDGRRTRTV